MYDSGDRAPADNGTDRLVVVGIAPATTVESVVDAGMFDLLRSIVVAVWGDPGWMGAQLRADIAPLIATPAGPELMAALASLRRGDCSADHEESGVPVEGSPPLGSAGNPCLCMLAIAAAWQACAGYAAACSRSAVVDVVGAEPFVLPRLRDRPAIGDPAQEELACALRLSPESAATRIRQSRALAARPDLDALIREGILPEASTIRIAESLGRLSDDDSAACAATLAGRVRRRADRRRRPWTGSDAADCARRLASRCGSYERSRRRAVADRHVRRWSNGDGTSTISAVLPEVTAERMYLRLTAMARGLGADDPRCLDARRADLLGDLVLGGEQAGTSGVEVHVVIDAATLLGLAEGAAEVPGIGALPAGLARELAADGQWRAWIRDAAGAVAATGSRTYRPTASVARLVRARESHCRMPGCRRPAARCDIDHAVPWPYGTTDVPNLGPLCRRHHILKTHTAWRLDVDRDGTVRWRTPAGATITDVPEPAVPVGLR